MPRRRSLSTSVRVALTSGLAATGWLLLGSAPAHAAEDTTPVAEAISVVEAGGTIASVTDALAPLSDTLAPIAGAVDELVATTPVVGEIVPEGTVSAVSAVSGTILVVAGDPGSIVADPVRTVETVTTPVTGTVDEVLSTTPVVGGLVPEGTVSTVTGTTVEVVRTPASVVADPVGTVETVTTPVTDVLAPVSGAVDEVIGTTPVADEDVPPGNQAPGLAPMAPAQPQPESGIPAAPAPTAPRHLDRTGPVQDEPVTAPSTAAAQAPFREPGAAARPATATTVTGVAPATLLPRFPWVVSTAGTGTGWDRADAVAGAAGTTPGGAGSTSSSHGGAPAPSGSSTSSGGGPGTPLGSTDPAGWAGMPASTFYLELFPRLSTGEANSFFAPSEDLPTAPVFDPGSTPD